MFLAAPREPLRHTGLSGVPHLPQGNLFDFLRLTEWRGPRVLYFGDHLYSDLAVRGRDRVMGRGVRGGSPKVGAEPCARCPQDLMLRHGWRTGAIIPELEREIRIINTEQYMHSLTWQQALTGLLERMQVCVSGASRERAWAATGAHTQHTPCLAQTYQDAESRQVLAAWMKERQELR